MSAAPLRRRAPARPAPPARRPHAAPRRPVPGARVVRPAGAAVLDRLLSGRLWIGLVFLLLVGIVFFNVDLLRMNRDIAATAQKAETIKRENARLRGDLARLGSSERIQTTAAQRGLVLPAAGEVRYLKATGADTKNALARLRAGGGSAITDPVPPAQAEPGEPSQEQVATTTPPATAPQGATPQATTTPQESAPQQPTSPQAPVAVAPQATPQTGQ